MLRDYQKEALDSILSTTESGIVVAPTGSGKTHIMASLYSHYESTGRSVLFVAWELSVRSQLIERYGVPKSAIVAPTVDLIDADIIIIDEVHHFHDSWSDWMLCCSERWIGFTATPRHCDSYTRLYTIPYHTLREDGWIGEKLSAVIAKSQMDAEVATDGLHTVTYISQRKDYKCWMGRLILADTPASERHFRDGEYRLCCIATLTTGWDDPDIEAVILSRRIGRINPQTYVQILGRLRRGGLVVDLSDNVMRFGLDEDALIAQMSELDRPDKPLAPAVMKRCIRCERLVAARASKCPHCGAELPPVVDGAGKRFWARLDDTRKWEGILLDMDWQERKPCPFTKSGSWPVKLPSGTTAYISERTTWHWRDSIRRLIDMSREGEVYYLGEYLLDVTDEPYKIYSYGYGEGFRQL